MTGFGDVSVLGTIYMLLDRFQADKGLFDFSEKIIVFTSDKGLIKKITTEFNGKNVVVKSPSEIK
jgi:hypothetical protein